jgi:hypothetical protein
MIIRELLRQWIEELVEVERKTRFEELLIEYLADKSEDAALIALDRALLQVKAGMPTQTGEYLVWVLPETPPQEWGQIPSPEEATPIKELVEVFHGEDFLTVRSIHTSNVIIPPERIVLHVRLK